MHDLQDIIDIYLIDIIMTNKLLANNIYKISINF